MIIDPDENSLPPDSDATAFYAQIGRAITQWARIEGMIFDLFVFALVIDRYKAAVLFDKLGTIKPRLELTDTILSVSLHKQWYAKWQAYNKRILSLLEFRNNLAHNPVDKIGIITVGVSKMGFDYYSVTDRRKLNKKKNFVAGIDDIRKHNEEVSALIREMMNLGIPRRARKRPSEPESPRFPLSLVQAGHPANPQAREGRKRHLQSSRKSRSQSG